MSSTYTRHLPLSIGGELALRSDPGPHPWNVHRACVAGYRAGFAVAICEGDSLDRDKERARAHARIAAEVSAVAAAHTANAAAGLYAGRSALETSVADEGLPFPSQMTRIVTSLLTAVITDWTIDLCWTGESVNAFALTADLALHALIHSSPHQRTRPPHAIGPVRRRQVWREPPGPGHHDERILDIRRLLLCSDSLTLPLGTDGLSRLLRRDTRPPRPARSSSTPPRRPARWTT
ncbi:unnamed protein product [[Actinomadura] parvosata subsp. kistnae]|uniref:hypothetical protein n=1 Tax=[Actinomadura] parvosata TaxID=1955412 RepID=UPI000D28FA2D|nr:unnamed protein product [Actinomadura parvosata subsp. kistnae]